MPAQPFWWPFVSVDVLNVLALGKYLLLYLYGCVIPLKYWLTVIKESCLGNHLLFWWQRTWWNNWKMGFHLSSLCAVNKCSSAAVLGVTPSCSSWTTHGMALSFTGFTGGFTPSSCKPSLISQPPERCWGSILLTFAPCSSPIHQWGRRGPAWGGNCAGEQGGSHGLRSQREPFPKDHVAEGWPAPGRGWQTHVSVQRKKVTGSS